MPTRGGRSHFFRLRLCSCSNIFESGSGSWSGNFSNLMIRLLFRLRYNHRSNYNLPMFLLKKWPHRLLLLPKLKNDSRSGFSQIFDSGSGSERKTQNPAGVNSGSGPTSGAKPRTRYTWPKMLVGWVNYLGEEDRCLHVALPVVAFLEMLANLSPWEQPLQPALDVFGVRCVIIRPSQARRHKCCRKWPAHCKQDLAYKNKAFIIIHQETRGTTADKQVVPYFSMMNFR